MLRRNEPAPYARHKEIKNPTVIRICKQLSVPDPLR
jgi:hypothetical protein